VTGSAESDVRQASELLLHSRRRWYESALEENEQSVAGSVATGDSAAARTFRERLLTGGLGALERHCERTLGDLVVLLRLFQGLASAALLRQRLEAHVDEVASALADRLPRNTFSGGALTSAEQKRITNRVSTLKLKLRQDWEAEVSGLRALEQRRKASAEGPTPGELDDRLPLQRPAAFDRDLRDAVENARRSGDPVSLVMIDLDHFKSVNDRYGHPVGDEVLLAVSGLAVKRVAHKGGAYRYGGEEFAVLLPGYSADEAAGLAERIRKDVAAAEVGSPRLKVTASFGVACAPDDAGDPKALLERADAALYGAKHGGRNQVRCAGDEA